MYVLVHGSWHDGSAWDETRSALRERGIASIAPNLPGRGPGARKDVAHQDYVRAVVDAVEREDLRDVVLVGHSFGGSVIARALEPLAGRVRRLVFFAAFVVRDKHRIVDEVPDATAAAFRALAAESGDGTLSLPFELFRERFINDADLAGARAVYARLHPEPYGPNDEPLDLEHFYASTVPRSYLHCTEDTVQPHGGWHPGMSERLGMYRLVQMPGSHEVMFTHPTRLADKLVEAGRD
jgi:pimeloyl-ACP methyl ester carboxylesterase